MMKKYISERNDRGLFYVTPANKSGTLYDVLYIGLDHIEEMLGMVLRDPSRPEEISIEQERMMSYIEQALKAEFIFKRNKDYLVQSGKVIIMAVVVGQGYAFHGTVFQDFRIGR